MRIAARQAVLLLCTACILNLSACRQATAAPEESSATQVTESAAEHTPAASATEAETVNSEEPAQEIILESTGADGYTVYIPSPADEQEGMPSAPWHYKMVDASSGKVGSSFVVAGLYPVTEEQDWSAFLESQLAFFQEYAEETFGTSLYSNIALEALESKYSGTTYVLDFQLDDGNAPVAVTVCYSFGQSYSLVEVGVSTGDSPGLRDRVVASARKFRDETAEPLSPNPDYLADAAFSESLAEWPLPIANFFGIVREYVGDGFVDASRREDGTEDYIIEWEHSYMEDVARQLTGVENRPLRSSDLDGITELLVAFSVNFEQGTMNYYYDSGNGKAAITQKEVITDLEGLQEFRNLTFLDWNLDTVTDISALREMPQLEVFWTTFSPEMEDLSPLGSLVNLRELLITSHDHAKVTDISFFATMEKLDTLYIRLISISDASVLAELPNLRQLQLTAADDLDRQPLIDAEHIVTLSLNGERIRKMEKE
ncbi:MAG: hypothetical protein ACK5LX_16005 [Oscillospiraceae bacterium]